MQIITCIIFIFCLLTIIADKRGWINLQKLTTSFVVFGAGASLLAFLCAFAFNDRNGSDKNISVPVKSPPQSNQKAVLFEHPVPRRVDNDVIVPRIIIQTIPGFNENKIVYAATYKNNWLICGDKAQTIAALDAWVRITRTKFEVNSPTLSATKEGGQ